MCGGKEMKINLYNEDCIKKMKDFEENSVDMILTDLPYSSSKRKITWNEWDKQINLEELWKEYKRIIKENGVIALFAQDLFSAELIELNKKEYKYKWIWQKESGTGFLNSKRMPLKNFEEILIFYNKQCTYNPQMTEGKAYTTTKGRTSSNYCSTDKIVTTKNAGLRYPTQILKFNRERGLHPTQKPILLLEYLIKTYTNENETVLDSCMGSGSTGVACVNTNRNFSGIEIDKDYYKIAEERINKEKEVKRRGKK